ncbi:hypothetical protein [Tenacibaculum sp. nBUS_03]|uniref:hypothetical protein n=1 Tax=Tenacibaculum sp. nBUS_03 TaxID=3395320 RepID=UPI003EBE60EE
MKTDIQIKTDLFPAYLDEENEINPGRFGKKLAEFIKKNLEENGVQVADLYPTDYAYEIRLDQFKFSVYISAGNIDGETDLFLVSLEPRKEFIRKFFKKIPTVETIEPIYNLMMDSFRGNSDIQIIEILTKYNTT